MQECIRFFDVMKKSINLLVIVGLCCVFAQFAYAQPNPEWMRVAIVQDESQIKLQVHGNFTMESQDGQLGKWQRQSLSAVMVRGVSEGIAVGNEVLPTTQLLIQPNDEAAISLNGIRLRGDLEIQRQAGNKLLVINHVTLEDYLLGVLSKEVPDYWPEEVLQAAAIAARSYALYQRLTKEVSAFDVTGDVMSQDYGGKASEKHRTSQAVRATQGRILMSQGKLFPTFYHSTCGGKTEHGRIMGKFDLQPLQGGVKCDFCIASPFYSWKRRLTREDFSWALQKSKHGRIGKFKSVAINKISDFGRAEQITIAGTERSVKLSGNEFRALFGFDSIRSSRFMIIPSGNGFVLDGHGWGHGVGMCQWGAAELARRGIPVEDILTFYYPGTDIVSLDQLVDQPIDVIERGV